MKQSRRDVDWFNTHCALLRKKIAAQPATYFAAAPLADRWPLLTWGAAFPTAAPPGLRQAELRPTHFATVTIGALGRYPGAARHGGLLTHLTT
jgi:hypothetical protein